MFHLKYNHSSDWNYHERQCQNVKDLQHTLAGNKLNYFKLKHRVPWTREGEEVGWRASASVIPLHKSITPVYRPQCNVKKSINSSKMFVISVAESSRCENFFVHFR